MLLLTLRGTPTLYYGDEIGLAHVTISSDRVQDPWERNEPGHGRDPERTPMQWDDSRNAGFSAGEPWLPLSPDAATRNVEWQRDDARSLLTLYRRSCAFAGITRPSRSENFAVFPFRRTSFLPTERHDGDATLRILLNFSASPQTVNFTAGNDGSWAILLSTHTDRPDSRPRAMWFLRPMRSDPLSEFGRNLVRSSQQRVKSGHFGPVSRKFLNVA